ncbi:unnamed protein product, partial [marine sediment metagenome]
TEVAHPTAGNEETEPMWNVVGEAGILFTVPIDETGLDILLIFLGLIMIPLSTLYLVICIRSRFSYQTKLFSIVPAIKPAFPI